MFSLARGASEARRKSVGAHLAARMERAQAAMFTAVHALLSREKKQFEPRSHFRYSVLT
jgi:5-carboxymethyl-2-hydroxymuconate isomerase